MEEEKLDRLALELSPESDWNEDEILSIQDKISFADNNLKIATNKLNNLVEVVVPPLPDEDEVTNIITPTILIAGGATALVFALHCVVWLLNFIFDITWNTWGWTKTVFFIGVVVSLLVSLFAYYNHKRKIEEYETAVEAKKVYDTNKANCKSEIRTIKKEIKQLVEKNEILHRERYSVLEHAFRRIIGVPIPQEAICEDDYSSMKKQYFSLLEMKNELENCDKEEEKMIQLRKYCDQKLEFLYLYSLKKEIPSVAYLEFEEHIKSCLKDSQNKGYLLRSEIDSSKSLGVSYINQLGDYKILLEDNRMDQILDSFEEVRNQSTGFLFFGGTKKMAQKTKDMQTLVEIAQEEYKEMADLSEKIMYALQFARGCAYRNIYLGVELVGYLRKNASKGKLTTEKDSFAVSEFKTDKINLKKVKIESNASGVALDTLGSFANTIMDNKELQKLALDNPKYTAGLAVLGAVASGAINYIGAVFKNVELQGKFIDDISTMVEGYQIAQGQALRSIEIIRAIVKANEGFMAIYKPLCRKVFIDNDLSITKADFATLGAATKEYQKISMSKINS